MNNRISLDDTDYRATEQVVTQNKKAKFLFIILAIVCLACVILGVAQRFSNQSADSNGLVSVIIDSAKTEISHNLKAPSSARYGQAEILGNDAYGRYLVYIPVDAQNGFGAYIRSEFLVIIMDVDSKNRTYSSYKNSSVFDVSDRPSCITKWKNGEVTVLMKAFLDLNHWGESR